MSPRVRRAGSTVAILTCLLVPGVAHAQSPSATPDGDLPSLRDEFPTGGGSQATPTPEPTQTPQATASATPEPTATARPGGGGQLAHTGSDTLPLALGGLSLIGFGLALRLRLALDDARGRHQLG